MGIQLNKRLLNVGSKECRLLVCVFLFFVSVARYWVNYDPDSVVPNTPEPYSIAHNLYEHAEFANPFIASETGPTAHIGPVAPGFLAAEIFLFGDRSKGVYAIQLIGCLLLGLQLSLLPVFSRTMGMGSLAGVIGALAWIAAKPNPYYGWGASYASFALAGALCLYRHHLDLDRSDGTSWALGFLIGVATLLLPTTAGVFGAWLAWDLWRRKAGFFRHFFLPLVMLPVLIVAPWTIRNYLVFHQFIPVRDDLGLELAVSNNDCAQFAMEENFEGCFQRLHPNASVSEAKKIIDLGEPEYNQLRWKEAVDWIKTHPRRFARLSAFRFIAWWMPTDSGVFRYPDYSGTERQWQRLVIYIMTLLSVAGLVLLLRRDAKSAAVSALTLAIFPLIYYYVQYQERYRVPVLWLTFLLGALPISSWARKVSWPTWARQSISSEADG